MNLYKNRKLRKSFGENAKRRVESRFVVETMVEQMERFYQAMHEKRGNGKLDLAHKSTESQKPDAVAV